MAFSGTIRIALASALAGAGAFIFIDRGVNYQETEARLISVKIDCYVESGDRKIVVKTTNETAYMNCAEAPKAAEHFGHAKSAVKKRAALLYEYQSPVDGSNQIGEFNGSVAETANFRVGQRVKIYAHTTTPGKSRWF
jgi:hypothetical protein